MHAKMKRTKTIVRRTTQPRAIRMQDAKVWLANYEGKNVVRGYAKKYRVDLLQAIQELKQLGVEINTEYEQAVRQTVAQRIEQNRIKKEESKVEYDGLSESQDWDFAFLVGYTSGGAPYGIRWKDMEERGL